MSKRELSPDVKIVSEPQEPEHLRLLKSGRAIISDRVKWRRNEYEYDGGYCALGALGWTNLKVQRRLLSAAERAAAEYLALPLNVGGPLELTPHQAVARLNDTGTHADVVAMFDLGIERATRDWLLSK